VYVTTVGLAVSVTSVVDSTPSRLLSATARLMLRELKSSAENLSDISEPQVTCS